MPGVPAQTRAFFFVASSRALLPLAGRLSGGEPDDLYASWYPPLRSTLVVLSKIYRAVDMGVFEDLAGEAVGLCTDALKAAALQVCCCCRCCRCFLCPSHPCFMRPEGPSTPQPPPPLPTRARLPLLFSAQVTARRGETSDGDLFLVKHLLILREQLTPFDINFSQVVPEAAL